MSAEIALETTDPPRRGMRRGILAAVAGLATIVALLVADLVLIPRYRPAHPATALQRSDADRVAVDDLYLDVTLVTKRFLESRSLARYLGDRDADSVLPILVGVNAHTGSIEHMHHLDGELFVIGRDGARYPALTEPIVLTQHHNAYMLLFPPRDNAGLGFLDESQGAVRLEAVGMGDVAVRRFEWSLPLDERTGQGLAATLMLAVALISALLVVLSPCALELTLYYSAIISCTVGEGEREVVAAGGAKAESLGRRRVIVNLASFVVGFTLIYSVAGATVGLIGQGVRQPMGEYAELLQIVGGSLILFFAMRVLGLDRHLGRLLGRVGRMLPDLGIARAWGLGEPKAAPDPHLTQDAWAISGRRPWHHAGGRLIPGGDGIVRLVRELHGWRRALPPPRLRRDHFVVRRFRDPGSLLPGNRRADGSDRPWIPADSPVAEWAGRLHPRSACRERTHAHGHWRSHRFGQRANHDGRRVRAARQSLPVGRLVSSVLLSLTLAASLGAAERAVAPG